MVQFYNVIFGPQINIVHLIPEDDEENEEEDEEESETKWKVQKRWLDDVDKITGRDWFQRAAWKQLGEAYVQEE